MPLCGDVQQTVRPVRALQLPQLVVTHRCDVCHVHACAELMAVAQFDQRYDSQLSAVAGSSRTFAQASASGGTPSAPSLCRCERAVCVA